MIERLRSVLDTRARRGSPRQGRRAFVARRALRVAMFAVLPSIVSCQTSQAGQGSEGSALVDPREVPDEVRDEWEALVAAQSADPESDAVDAAADALLAAEPPPRVRAQALLAKADRHYLRGEDDLAIALSQQGLGLLEPSESKQSPKRAELEAELTRVSALSHARGGEPSLAIERLDQLETWGVIEPEQLRGARAAAFDRSGDSAAALAAFAGWRELLADDAPAAGYAQERIGALSAHLDRSTILGLADQATGPLAADCLRATLGIDPGPGAPAWVADCRPLPTRIGILLPRSGRLAALADAQFAAAVAAVTVLSRERPVSFMWQDSGSSAKSAKAGANRLLADGADVIVGPVGRTNVEAAITATGDARLIVPGEGGVVDGVAPSLEDRAMALVAHAQRAGASEVIVLTPSSGYGRRVRTIEKTLEGTGLESLKFIDYSPSSTSFGPTLEPALKALEQGAALVIADALPRTEMIVRQLRRSGLRVVGGRIDEEGTEVMVLGTGEGLAPSAYDATHASLDGVILAPVAHPDAESRAFEDEYRAQQGQPPDDQALLVWRALRAAWSGQSGHVAPSPVLVQVQGGALVAVSAP